MKLFKSQSSLQKLRHKRENIIFSNLKLLKNRFFFFFFFFHLLITSSYSYSFPIKDWSSYDFCFLGLLGFLLLPFEIGCWRPLLWRPLPHFMPIQLVIRQHQLNTSHNISQIIHSNEISINDKRGIIVTQSEITSIWLKLDHCIF